ncbi:MAG: hypothetical protein LBB39_01595 [Mycoplasmataceae bacterium]|nr:hypothetical protein [Mycoplasmataceae bacterium]
MNKDENKAAINQEKTTREIKSKSVLVVKILAIITFILVLLMVVFVACGSLSILLKNEKIDLLELIFSKVPKLQQYESIIYISFCGLILVCISFLFVFALVLKSYKKVADDVADLLVSKGIVKNGQSGGEKVVYKDKIIYKEHPKKAKQIQFTSLKVKDEISKFFAYEKIFVSKLDSFRVRKEIERMFHLGKTKSVNNINEVSQIVVDTPVMKKNDIINKIFDLTSKYPLYQKTHVKVVAVPKKEQGSTSVEYLIELLEPKTKKPVSQIPAV